MSEEPRGNKLCPEVTNYAILVAFVCTLVQAQEVGNRRNWQIKKESLESGPCNLLKKEGKQNKIQILEITQDVYLRMVCVWADFWERIPGICLWAGEMFVYLLNIEIEGEKF